MSKHNRHYEPKPLFIERINLLFENEKDKESYWEILKKPLQNSIRCNTLKITPDELKKRLERKWKITQPFKEYPEIMIVEGNNDETKLGPGELGRALEHLLGYYYVQEISSMLPVLALDPKPNEKYLDLCSSPGSKTTQASARMKNQGLIVANDVKVGRLKILSANLGRCGTGNVVVTKKDGIALCRRFERDNIKFDKILVDAPCSGEGTLRSSPKTFQMWNIHTVKNLSRLQKALAASALMNLKVGGEMVYSTCTHSPEENEEVVNFLLKEFKGKIKVETIKLPVKCRQGLSEWADEKYDNQVTKACRIYPQDNDTEGFFLAKIKLLKEIN